MPGGARAGLEGHQRGPQPRRGRRPMIGSCRTVPVNQSADMRRDGVDPAGRSSMDVSVGFRFSSIHL
jgi:hypothetical protein